MASLIFLLLLLPELLRDGAVFGRSGQACTSADADAASLNADPAGEMPKSVALDDGEPGLSPFGPWRCWRTPWRSLSAFISAARSA